MPNKRGKKRRLVYGRKLKGKAVDSIKHLIKRVDERLKIDLTQQQLESITSIIRNNGAIKVKKVSTYRTIHRLEFEGKLIDVVYNKNLGVPVTVLFVNKDKSC